MVKKAPAAGLSLVLAQVDRGSPMKISPKILASKRVDDALMSPGGELLLE